MPFAFFGLCLEPEKTYSQTVSKSFRISMASLGEEITSTERSCVKVVVDGEEFVLCSLNPGSHEQQTLDLVFETEEEISLSVTGKNTVHLTGNYLPEEDHEHDHDDMEYDSAEFESSDDDVEGEEDYSDEEEVSQEDLDRLRALVASHAEDDDEDSEEDPDFSELDEDEDDEEDLEDDEEEDEDVDEDMEDAEPVEIGQKRKAEKASPMAEKKMKDNTAAAVKTVQPSKAEKTIKTEKNAEITATTESKTASETQASADKPLSKKQKKAAAAKARAEQEAEKAKAKPVEKVGEVQKAKAKPEVKVAESPIKKVLGNGLQIEDVKVGTGVRAKKGKKVGVRYIGKLASNGKVFDKNVSGKPFVFNLGRGEVIKGWDMGVDGMSVGGERRLVIPAVLAYGARGAPPDIPKNATLEFEVKLLSVN